MKVPCPFSSEHQVPPSELKEHLKLCPKAALQCRYCYKELPRDQVDSHCAFECLERKQQMVLPPEAKLEVMESEGLESDEEEEILQLLSAGCDFSEGADGSAMSELSDSISDLLKRNANIIAFSGPEGEATFFSRTVLQVKHENLRVIIFVGKSK